MAPTSALGPSPERDAGAEEASDSKPLSLTVPLALELGWRRSLPHDAGASTAVLATVVAVVFAAGAGRWCGVALAPVPAERRAPPST
eukprot:272379-Chlamydomonas_euryale.AAC.1